MRRLEISQKDIHQRFQRISTGTPLECCLGPRNEIEGIGGNLVKRGGGGGVGAIFWWECATGTPELLAYTRPCLGKFCIFEQTLLGHVGKALIYL